MLTDPAMSVTRARRVCAGLLAAFVLLTLAARADDIARTGGPYVPTPQEVVDRMLALAEVGARDYVIDLGSGDGRMVLTAARRYGARGLGVDLDPELVERSVAEAQRLGVADRVRFRVEDVTRTPLRGASVITLYLLPGITRLLVPRFLAELAPGSRIVAHDFDLGDWKADREITVDVKEKYGSAGTWKSTLFLYTVPANVRGTWEIDAAGPHAGRMLLRFEQRYREITGTALFAGRSHAVADGQVHGTRVQFRLGPQGGPPDAYYEGAVEDGHMHGTVEHKGRRAPWSATRLTLPAGLALAAAGARAAQHQ